MLAVCALAIFVLGFVVSGFVDWGTCNGRLGEPGKKETVGTEEGHPLEPEHLPQQ